MIKALEIEHGVFLVVLTEQTLEVVDRVCKKRSYSPDFVISELLYGCLKVDDTNFLLKGKQNGMERKDG